jgi:hypothetical protein
LNELEFEELEKEDGAEIAPLPELGYRTAILPLAENLTTRVSQIPVFLERLSAP